MLPFALVAQFVAPGFSSFHMHHDIWLTLVRATCFKVTKCKIVCMPKQQHILGQMLSVITPMCGVVTLW